MKSYDLVLTREKLLHAAPEYVADYLARITDDERNDVLNLGLGDRAFVGQMQARHDPVIDMVLARYLGMYGVSEDTAHGISPSLRDSTVVALMAGPPHWNTPHDPGRNWCEVSDAAKIALGQNQAIDFRWLANAIAGTVDRKVDDETLGIILHSLLSNLSFQDNCRHARSSIVAQDGDRWRATSEHADPNFEKFMTAVFADLEGSAVGKEGRASIYELLLLQLPKAKIAGDQVQLCATNLHEEWRRPSLAAAFCAMSAANLRIEEVRTLLLSSESPAIRRGLYRGARGFTENDVRDWLGRDELMCAVALAENECTYHRPGETEMLLIAADGEVVGSIGYWEITREGAPAYETGWEILPAHHGRGIGARAAAALMAKVKPVAAFRYVFAFPTPDNPGSNGICRKLGFDLVAVEEAEYPKGVWSPHNIWRLDLTRFAPAA